MFSKDIVFVEGSCDKIVIRLRFISVDKDKVANIEENEGSIEEDIINALRFAKELPSLENRVQQTKKELENIEKKKG